MEYNAVVELDVLVANLTVDDFSSFLDPIARYRGVVGVSDNGRIQLTITVDAVDAIHATGFVYDLTRAVYPDHRVNCVDVMPSSDPDAVPGFGDHFGSLG